VRIFLLFLRWWREREKVGSRRTTSNKLGKAGILADREALPSFSCRHGDGGKSEGILMEMLDPVAMREEGVQILLSTPEALIYGGVHQRKPRFAEAIYGHGSRSALGCWKSPGFFLLHWRILDLGVGFLAGYTPSGYVPGGAAGAYASRSSAMRGEEEALDCFPATFSKGLVAKCMDQTVFSFIIFRVLYVIVLSPLK
jgi:hypothetical protein